MKILKDVDKKFHDSIKKNAKESGLDQIGPESFSLYKTGIKSLGHKLHDFVDRGNVFIVGNDDYVWIVLMNLGSWFKTSPVLECVRTDMGFDIETENSYYRLDRN